MEPGAHESSPATAPLIAKAMGSAARLGELRALAEISKLIRSEIRDGADPQTVVEAVAAYVTCRLAVLAGGQ